MPNQPTNRLSNLLGALSLAVADQIREATEQAAGVSDAGPAALVSLRESPSERTIEELRLLVGLTHSGGLAARSSFHRAQIRDHLGYRVATLADQEKLTGWLSEAVAHAERRPDRVREELLAEFRRLRIEPPTAGRILRMVRSALRTAEQSWASRIAGRLNPSVAGHLLSLIAVKVDDDPDSVNGESASLIALIKASPGNVSLESMMAEIGKLQAVRALDLPAGLFRDVAPKVLDEWRARATVEAPSHLRRHPKP